MMTQVASIAFVLSFSLAGCQSRAVSSSDAQAPVFSAKTPLFAEEAGREFDRLKRNRLVGVARDFNSRAKERFEGRAFSMVMIGTDSTNAGRDSWRGCAKLTREQFGLSADALAEFVDQYGVSCSTSSRGYVAMVFAAIPKEELDRIKAPVHLGEAVEIAVIPLPSP